MGINRVGTICIFVSDQDRAKAFYSKVLGFQVRQDMPLTPGSSSRWLAVAPRGAETEIILYLPDENWKHYSQVVGKPQAVTLDVRGMKALVEKLKVKKVKFVQEPDKQPWGTFAIIEDSEGNQILLVEQPKKLSTKK